MSYSCTFQLVALLLRYGADPLKVNSRGKAPIDVAADDVILRLLKSEGRPLASYSSDDASDSEVRKSSFSSGNLITLALEFFAISLYCVVKHSRTGCKCIVGFSFLNVFYMARVHV